MVELQEDALDAGGQVLDARHGGVEVAQGDDFGIRLFVDVGFDRRVALQRGAAGQRLAAVALEVHQRERVRHSVVHLADADLDLAGAAQAVPAGMRNVDALAQRGVEQRLAVLDLDGRAQGFNGEVVAHAVPGT